MVDPDRVARRLERLEELLVELERIRDDEPDALRTDRRTTLAALHALQLALQIVLDLGTQLSAERRIPIPDTYREIFPALAQAGTIPSALGESLAQAAALRNVLVHEYLDVDLDEVSSALNRLDDLRAFGLVVQRATNET
ncbi:MAG: type VII toxin-antitoxin system HepT family RNase toxin [Solirubrobacteraceae bacterium]